LHCSVCLSRWAFSMADDLRACCGQVGGRILLSPVLRALREAGRVPGSRIGGTAGLGASDCLRNDGVLLFTFNWRRCVYNTSMMAGRWFFVNCLLRFPLPSRAGRPLHLQNELSSTRAFRCCGADAWHLPSLAMPLLQKTVKTDRRREKAFAYIKPLALLYALRFFVLTFCAVLLLWDFRHCCVSTSRYRLVAHNAGSGFAATLPSFPNACGMLACLGGALTPSFLRRNSTVSGDSAWFMPRLLHLLTTGLFFHLTIQDLPQRMAWRTLCSGAAGSLRHATSAWRRALAARISSAPHWRTTSSHSLSSLCLSASVPRVGCRCCGAEHAGGR